MKLNQDKTASLDEEIDAALQLLREVQSPAAMMSRLQPSLENAAVKSQRARSSGLFWIPVTGAVAAGVLFLAFSHGGWTTEKRSHAVETAETARMSTTTPGAGETVAARPALVLAETYRKRNLAAQPAVVRRIRREHPRYRHVANLLSYPLTRQEKLLVRFVETAKPADLQALNPEYQAKVEAQHEAEFAAYLKSGSSSDSPATEETN
jgi:hypothetical protein